MDEVRDVGPATTVPLWQFHRIPVVRLVAGNPKLGKAVLRERLPLAASAVGILLVAHHHRLAEDRRKPRLELLANQSHPGRRVGLFGQRHVHLEQLTEAVRDRLQRQLGVAPLRPAQVGQVAARSIAASASKTGASRVASR